MLKDGKWKRVEKKLQPDNRTSNGKAALSCRLWLHCKGKYTFSFLRWPIFLPVMSNSLISLCFVFFFPLFLRVRRVQTKLTSSQQGSSIVDLLTFAREISIDYSLNGFISHTRRRTQRWCIDGCSARRLPSFRRAANPGARRIRPHSPTASCWRALHLSAKKIKNKKRPGLLGLVFNIPAMFPALTFHLFHPLAVSAERQPRPWQRRLSEALFFSESAGCVEE